MPPGQFQRTLRRHGPALASWPDQDRRTGLRLLRLSRSARAMLADALDFPGPAPVDDAALLRMQRGLDRQMARRGAARVTGRSAKVGAAVPHMRWAALAACALAGTAIGLDGTDQADSSDVLAALQVPAIGQVSQ